jgi:hypothetical protein
MAQYSLRILYGNKPLEFFAARSPAGIQRILEHPAYHLAGQLGPWGEDLEHPNRFEIFDMVREKLFDGNIQDALYFVSTLR